MIAPVRASKVIGSCAFQVARPLLDAECRVFRPVSDFALTHIITTYLEAQPPSQKNEGLKREHLLPGCNTIRVCAQLD
jgi:hypothetical protein